MLVWLGGGLLPPEGVPRQPTWGLWDKEPPGKMLCPAPRGKCPDQLGCSLRAGSLEPSPAKGPFPNHTQGPAVALTSCPPGSWSLVESHNIPKNMHRKILISEMRHFWFFS